MGRIRASVTHRRRTRLAGVLLAAAMSAGCTVAGSAVIAPYRSRPIGSIVAKEVLAGTTGALALAPNGSILAVADRVHGVCLRSVPSGRALVCADLRLTDKQPISAAFSPDSQIVALGRDVDARGSGSVWLVDVRTGKALPVPPIDGPRTTPSAGSERPAPAGSAYVAMIWNSINGHLLLISNSHDADGARTRVVDVDPRSLIPRVVAQATGPYEFQSGYLASGGPSVIFTVYRGDQLVPNPVVVDLDTGKRTEFGPLGAPGTQLVPLAVSPGGTEAIVGSATYGHSGPPQRLDLVTGQFTGIAGLSGDFVVAAYSPNGAQIAVVTTGNTGVLVAVASVAGGPARTVGQVRAVLTAGSRLSWSRTDTLSISSPTPLAGAAVVGWSLSN